MSDWARTLRQRLESLEAALHHTEEAKDDFLDRGDLEDLDRAHQKLKDIHDITESELAVADKDWRLIEDHAETIISLLVDAAEQMAADGLIHFDENHYDTSSAFDDEPTAIHDTRRYIENALNQWYEVRNAATEMVEEGGY